MNSETNLAAIVRAEMGDLISTYHFEVTGVSDNRTEFIVHQIRRLAEHMRSAGVDILEGSKAWTRQYGRPTIQPREEFDAWL